METLIAPPSGASSLVRRVRDLVPSIQGHAAECDDRGAFPVRDLDALRVAGAFVAPLPRSAGGLGLGTEAAGGAALAELLRLIGRANLVVGRVFEGHVNALRLIMRYGTVAQVGRATDDAWSGALFAVWNTQAADAPLRLTGDRLIGSKTLASAAGYVTCSLVTADLDDGRRQMVLARLALGERADVSGWTAQGMRGSATGRVAFDGLAVDAYDLIGAPEDYVAQPEFSGGAWRVLAVLAGGLDGLAEAFAAHLVARGRDGDPHQRARAGQVFALQQTARLWVGRAAEIAEGPHDTETIVAFVDLARGAVEAACLDAMQLVQRSIGLQGFMRPEPVERICRDLATYLRQPAPDAALTHAGGYFLRHDLP